MAASNPTPRVDSWTIPSTNGVRIAAKSWVVGTSAKRHLLFTHGTGLTKECLEPMIERFLAHVSSFSGTITAIDTRFHGSSAGGTLSVDGNWWLASMDVHLVGRAIIARYGQGDLIGVGHSMGACLLLMAQHLGATFSKLFLIEPIVIPGEPRFDPNVDFALMARKRRRDFPSSEAAIENFRQKGIFKTWDAEALRAYVLSAFQAAPTEQAPAGVALRLVPEDEGTMFALAGSTGLLTLLSPLPVPVLLVAGEQSSWWRQVVAGPLEQKLGVTVELLPSLSHSAPFEQPARLAERLATFLA